MLILSRRISESLIFGDKEIVVTILGVKGNQVRIGIQAEKKIKVDREEVYLRKKQEGHDQENDSQENDHKENNHQENNQQETKIEKPRTTVVYKNGSRRQGMTDTRGQRSAFIDSRE